MQRTDKGTSSDENGDFALTEIEPGNYTLAVSSIGYETLKVKVTLKPGETRRLNLALNPTSKVLEETVVTGTLKPVNRLNSPVPVEVYSPTYLKKNRLPVFLKPYRM